MGVGQGVVVNVLGEEGEVNEGVGQGLDLYAVEEVVVGVVSE